MLIFAKGIASGYPMAGLATRAGMFDKLAPGTMGGTYGGNAVACAAAVATLEAIEEEGILGNAEQRGAELMRGLVALAQVGGGGAGRAVGGARGHVLCAVPGSAPWSQQPQPAAPTPLAHPHCDGALCTDGSLLCCQSIADSLLPHTRRPPQEYPEIVDVRGRGLMIGVEFGGREGRGSAPAKGVAAAVVKAAAAEDLLLMPSGARECIRILPPLVLTAGEAQVALERLGRVLQRVLRK